MCMSNRTWPLAAGVAVLASLSCSSTRAEISAPVEARAIGDWVGSIEEAEGKRFRVALHVGRQGRALAGVIDSPDQGAFGLPIANIRAEGDALDFDLTSVGGRYEGRWDAVRQAFVGAWSQGGATTPLALTRGGYPFPFGGRWDDPMVQGFSYAPAKAAPARVGPRLRAGKCINMSDMLDAPTEGAWGPPIAEDDFRILRAAGFTTVRIPVAFSAHAAETPPYAIDPVFLARVRHVVDLASASGLQVMLDLHNYDALMRDPEGQSTRYTALWRQVAVSFAQAPPSVWFELLNEPHDKLDNDNLGRLYRPALAAIRATNPRRTVIVGPQWNNLDKMLAFTMPDDPYVTPSFHYYDPVLFTHQGAPWADPTPPIGRPFGSAQDKAELDGAVDKVRAYIARTGRVPIVGEYGVQDDPRVPLAQRIRYYGAVSAAFASVGVDSCAWGYRTGFRLRDGDHWLPGAVEAIQATR
jgi:endoglucanase